MMIKITMTMIIEFTWYSMCACQLLIASCCVPSPADCYRHDGDNYGDGHGDGDNAGDGDNKDGDVYLGGAPQQPAPPLSAAIQ